MAALDLNNHAWFNSPTQRSCVRGAVADRIYWRDAEVNDWQHSQLVGNVTELVLPNVSIDDFVFAWGLVERAFGSRLFAAATGRRGGQRRSKAKAAVARVNDATGGRPRKRVSA